IFSWSRALSDVLVQAAAAGAMRRHVLNGFAREQHHWSAAVRMDSGPRSLDTFGELAMVADSGSGPGHCVWDRNLFRASLPAEGSEVLEHGRTELDRSGTGERTEKQT